MWEFYSTLAKRDLFGIRLESYMCKWQKAGEIILFFLKYIIAFPFYTFFWFVVFSIFLIFLAKSFTIQEIFFISISMISFTRIAAYYKEELANDIAKIIPITFLVTFLLNPTSISIEDLLTKWNYFLSSFPGILSYLGVTISLEWILRVLYLLKARF